MKNYCRYFFWVISFFLFSFASESAKSEPLNLYGNAVIEQAYGSNLRIPVLSRQELNLTGDKSVSDFDFKLSGRFRADKYLSPNSTQEGDLREVRANYRKDTWLVSIGRQSIVWGKADFIPVLDVVHPFDYREFILDDRESSRRSLTMLRVEKRINLENFAQVLVIPERRMDIIPAPEDRFSEAWGVQSVLENTVGGSDKSSEWFFSSPGVGFKWENSSTNLGWTVNALNRWSPQPYFIVDGLPASFREVNYRQWVIGGTFDLQWSDWVVRGEFAHLPTVYLPASSLGVNYMKYNQNSWMLGIDRNIKQWLIGAQFFQTSHASGSVRPINGRTQNTVTVSATNFFWQDRCQVKGFVARDLSENGIWLRATVSYQLYSRLKISLQKDEFKGDDSSLLGKIEDESRFKLGVKYDF